MSRTTNNPNGRPKGIPNRITSDLRERLSAFLSDRWEQIEDDFDQLQPSERLRLYEKLLSYALPRMQTVEYVSDTDRMLDGLTDEQLETLTQTLLKRSYENERREN